jgi:hypothetical protein
VRFFHDERGVSLILGVTSKFTVDQLFRCAYCGICAFFLLSIVLIYVFSSWQKEEHLLLSGPEKRTEVSKTGEVVYGAIGTGALALNSAHLSSFSPNLSEEILILAKNTRPDLSNQEASILIRFKSSQQEQLVVGNVPLFLHCQTREDGSIENVSVSAEPTPLWIRPVILDQGRVLIEIGKDENRGQFIVQAGAELGARASALIKGEVAYVHSLKQAKWWGCDALVQHYGGEEYKPLQNKHKMEFAGGQVGFVSSGDYLMWDGQQWQVSSLETLPRDLPVAHIKSATSKGAEIEVWDASGFQLTRVRLDLQHVSQLNYKMENLPTSIRMRTRAQVTCTFGKRRLILREGDWLLKTPAGWRNLRKVSDIEDCIQHKIRGELFIFDSLEKEKGRTTLKGNVFDEMRTQIQPIAIPIVMEKKASLNSTTVSKK